MKKKTDNIKNYLDMIPQRNPNLGWNKDENGIVVLSRENKGVANKIAQLIFRKPKVSYIHLDEIGSCVWPEIDGIKSIYELGECVRERFGDKAEPLYERLAKYFSLLVSCGFVTLK